MANIDFVCHADHANDTRNTAGPTITLNDGLWSYCGRGACEHHRWERVPTTTLTEIQLASRPFIVVAEAQEERATQTSAFAHAPNRDAVRGATRGDFVTAADRRAR